jgi:hypothetical protein
MVSSVGLARNIFLNGKDISSAKGQKLDKVNVFISENGDIFITAPQYQVFEEKTFVPIAKSKSSPPTTNSHPAILGASGQTSPGTPVSKVSEHLPPKEEDSQKLKEKAGTRFID